MLRCTLALLFASSILLPDDAKAPAVPKVSLKGTTQVGDQWQATLSMQVEGQIAIRGDEKVTTLDVKAKAEHKVDERVLAAADGCPTRVGRFYHQARADIQTHSSQQTRGLRPEKRFQVAQQTSDGLVVYCPNGPLTREELDLCGDHVDILALRGILPGKEVAPGETWEVPMLIAQCLADVDGVVENKLTAKIEKLEGDLVTLLVAGKVDGIQNGAESKVELKISVLYHLTEKRFMEAEWKQRRTRSAGPVHPQSMLETATKITWTQPFVSTELLDAWVAQVPAEPTPAHLVLLFRDQKERFTFTYDRNWQVVANQPDQIVLRCLDRGELVAQANIRPWTSARPGEHLDPKELQQQATQAPGFTLDTVAEQSPLSANPGYWIYRLAAVGRAGELPLAQTTYAVAGPRGDQLILTFTCEVSKAMKLGAKDLAIVKTVEFPTVVQAGGK